MVELETIGAFARRVGLTPGALRFYDDCGLLAPAVVEPGSGYRRYGREQEARAVLLRRLREGQVPLPAAGAVLDGDRAAAVQVLRDHLERLARDYEPARRAVVGLLADLGEPVGGDGALGGCRAVLAGADHAAALRQVAVFAVLHPVVPEAAYAALACVRVEVGPGEVTVVASDRVHLAVRTVLPFSVEGAGAGVCVPAAELREVSGWVAAQHEVTLAVAGGDGVVTLTGDSGDRRVVSAPALDYPDWRAVVGRLPRPRARAVLDRRALLRELEAADGRPVVVDVDPGRGGARLEGGQGPVALRGTCTGEPTVVRYDPRVLAAALAAGVGPDVVLELVAADQPVVVRSADAGSATTLVMPLGDADPAGELASGPGTAW